MTISSIQALKDAINAANATAEVFPYIVHYLELAPGTEFNFTEIDNGGSVSGYNALPVIEAQIVLEGNGAVFNREPDVPAFRFLRINSGALTVRNLTLRGGAAEGPGAWDSGKGTAILGKGDLLYLEDCIFEDNGSTTGANEWAVVNCHGALRCIFKNNTGGLTVQGEVTDCVFEDNTVRTAISATGTLLVEHCLFTNNKEGIYASGKELTVRGCTFTGNVSRPIYVRSGPSTVIEECHFEQNTKSLAISGSVRITRCAFHNNTSGQGGAIEFGTSDVIISNCDFIDNVASDRGGAIRLSDSGGSFIIQDTRFIGNSGSNAGALHIGFVSGPKIEITRCIFEDNSSGGSGGAIVSSAPSSWTPASLTIRASHFGYNTAASRGGAIYLNHNHAFLENCTLIGNQATGGSSQGGAVYQRNDGAPETTVTRSIISGNTAAGISDGIYNAHETDVIDASHNWWGALDGPGGAGPGSGDAVSTNVIYDPYWAVSGPSAHEAAECNCETHKAGTCKVSSNPIDLRLGEKRQITTDLSLNTPRGPLVFKRFYRQSQQDRYQFMGLGWNHEHNLSLEETVHAGAPNDITVYGTGSSAVSLVETADGSNQFVAKAGSTATLVKDTGTGEYRMTSGDKSVYHFDLTTGRITRREWPSGEALDYSYDGSGNLTAVVDNGHDLGGGLKRQLVLRYYTSGDHAGQLYRVGDHTFDDTDPQNPTGRYVEFTYVLNKMIDANDDVVDGTDSLLASVRDVRGQVWTYDYYGQDVGEDDPRQLNFLVERQSPSVDTTGDGVVDGSLLLEQLSYTPQGDELAVNGDMELDSDWTDIVGAEPVTNEQSTAQVAEGTYARHVVADAAGEGIEGNSWDLTAGQTYLIEAQVYVVSGTVTMQVSGTTAFDRSSSSSGVWETLRAVHVPSSGSTGHTLQFVADGGAAEFYVDAVSITESDLSIQAIQQARGNGLQVTDFSFQPVVDVATQTTETVDGFTTTHHFGNGVYLGTENPTGEQPLEITNEQYRPAFRQDAKQNVTWLDWQADLIDNGDMEDDDGWSAVGSPTQGPSTAQVQEGQQAWHVNAATAGEGIESTSWDLVADKTYTVRAWVYPVSGVVKLQASGTTALDALSTGAGAWEELAVDYTPTASSTGHTLQFVAEGGAAEFYVDRVTLKESDSAQQLSSVTDAAGNTTRFGYDAQDRLLFSLDAEGRKTRYHYEDANHPRQPTAIKVFDADGVTLIQWQTFTYDASGNTLSEQTLDPTQYPTEVIFQEVSRTYYSSGDGAGLLETVTQVDTETPSNNQTTTYVYDTFGRVVQTNQSTTLGSCTKSRTVYDTAGNVVASICNYEPGTNPHPTTAAEAAALYDPAFPDQNRVTTYEYDALGRQIATTTNAGNTAEERTTLTVYDALGRVVRTIAHYVEDVNISDPYVADRSLFDHGPDGTQNRISDTAYNARGLVVKQVNALDQVTLYGYDAAGRQIKVVQFASQPDYDIATDPELANYVPSGVDGEDLITQSIYDANGNLVQSIDVLGEADFTVYDSLNRVVKTVRRAKDGATIALNPGDTGYDPANDPRSALYAPLDDPDRDLISLTEYDAMGRVVRRRDEIGNWTLFGYDALGRQVKTITNASQPFYATAGDPDLSDYVASSAPDEDIVSESVYDTDGRLMYSADTLDLQTWFAYDGLGRQIKTIVNPPDPVANDPRDPAYVPSTAPDEDIITQTVYDSNGRVQHTEDALGRMTRHVYDEAGRRVKSIQNYVPQGSSDPADWVWSESNSRWEDGSGTPIDHGSGDDLNRITQTIYDAQGRVQLTRDPRGNLARTVYDDAGRRVKTIASFVDNGVDPAQWVWSAANSRWEDGSGNPIDHGPANDQNHITQTVYDSDGRVESARDPAGLVTRLVYDTQGRRVKTIQNYEDGLFDPAHPDEDLVSQTVYNPAGQVVETIDPRGTRTTFTYDAVGRRQTVTQAAGTALAATQWTVYDKAGRVLRVIDNCTYDPVVDPAPHERDAQGNWLYDPVEHGLLNDRDLITERVLDKRGRAIRTRQPSGAVTATVYDKDGQVLAGVDPLGVVTARRYDAVRRLVRTVANHVDNGIDPADWVWSETNSRWEDGSGTPIDHATDNDQNIVADVALDKAGRRLSLRDPRGHQTTYTYDTLNRRTGLTDPLSQQWQTTYADLSGGGHRVEATNPLSQITRRDFDRVGRLVGLDYLDESPKLTPDVTLAYDLRGNRTLLSENDGAATVRETHFDYDKARRLTQVAFDRDGDTVVEDVVQYEYEAGGRRTKLILPDGQTVTYQYDAQGRLVGLTDWATQTTGYHYDQVGRLVLAERANDLDTRYVYDAGGRLRQLTHDTPDGPLARFTYDVDGRGNRTQAVEALVTPGASPTTIASDDDGIDYLQGSWASQGDFMESSEVGAECRVWVMGDTLDLTLGTGPDHGVCDIYVNTTFWGSRDTYAATGGEETISISLQGSGPHQLILRNTPNQHPASGGHVLSVKQVVLPIQYDLQTVQYGYDALARLLAADYYPAGNANATPTRAYAFEYDPAGNRTRRRVELDGVLDSDVSYSYNASNQLVSDGTHSFTYDAAGRLTGDGVNTYQWDRAGRLLSMGGSSYAYNGLGQRVRQTVSGVVREYLLDLQPGLVKVLAQDEAGSVTRYVHGPQGIAQQQQPGGSWSWPVQDGLGSVRQVMDDSLVVSHTVHYAPYGELWGSAGSDPTVYGFTGEVEDPNGLVHLRVRYYRPELGVFPSLDPVEGSLQDILTLNRYGYVAANVVNAVDPSGRIKESPAPHLTCIQVGLECPPGQQVYAGSQIVRGLCREPDNSRLYVPGTNHEYGPYDCPPGWSFLSQDRTGFISCTQDEITDHRFFELPQAWNQSRIRRPTPYGTKYFDCQHFRPSSPEGRLCQELAAAQRFASHSATIDQYYTLSFTLQWLATNKPVIQNYARQFGIPPALIAGIIGSELLWDYNSLDRLQDDAIRLQDSLGISLYVGGGPGFANPHRGTYQRAATFAGDRFDIEYDPERLVTDEGAIEMAGFIAWWLVQQYDHEPMSLTAVDMAAIFAAYRQGLGQAFRSVERFRNAPTENLPGNSRFALPLMRYLVRYYQ